MDFLIKLLIYIPLVLLIFQILGALTTVRAVMDTRTPQGSIAWVVALNTIPWLAVPAYWIFGGRKYESLAEERRNDLAHTKEIREALTGKLQAGHLLMETEDDLLEVFAKLAKLPFTQGNGAELLINGEATFQSIFHGIKQAKTYVLVQFYIMRDDELGRQFRDHLIAAAKRGLRVHVLYDGGGCPDFSKSFGQELIKAGVQISEFNTTHWKMKRFQLNFRNHRKIVVVDGKAAWTGGLNVGDEYLGHDPKLGFFRDTHLKLAGPVVMALQLAYAEDWHWAVRKALKELNWEPEAASEGASRQVIAVPTGPADILESCALIHLQAINAARTRLWIATPYFVPDEQFLNALHLAALRGVDVRIIVPEKPDNWLVNLSGWAYVRDLEKGGINFYRHQKGFMHQKVMLVDDDFCMVGSANFDNRSFRLNFEVTIGFKDHDFSQQVRRMLEQDFADSREVTVKDVDEKGFWWKFATRAARLMAPVQ